ncbi:hypothetical protein Hdeb2414_s0015g00445111 [Helianthus debilis subsp. tardiflorus]
MLRAVKGGHSVVADGGWWRWRDVKRESKREVERNRFCFIYKYNII